MRSILVSTTRGLNYTEVGAFCSAFLEIIEKLRHTSIKWPWTYHRQTKIFYNLEYLQDQFRSDIFFTYKLLYIFHLHFILLVFRRKHHRHSKCGFDQDNESKIQKYFLYFVSMFMLKFLIIPTNRLPKGRFAFVR